MGDHQSISHLHPFTPYPSLFQSIYENSLVGVYSDSLSSSCQIKNGHEQLIDSIIFFDTTIIYGFPDQ